MKSAQHLCISNTSSELFSESISVITFPDNTNSLIPDAIGDVIPIINVFSNNVLPDENTIKDLDEIIPIKFMYNAKNFLENKHRVTIAMAVVNCFLYQDKSKM